MKLSSRRVFLIYLSKLAALMPLSKATFGQNYEGRTEYTDAAAADKWMNAWIQEQTGPDGKSAMGMLHLSRFADPIYFLTKEIGWRPNEQQAPIYKEIRVPIGFVTDFASIPRIFWSILRPDGLYSYAAIVHDYLYWEQRVAREVADNIFKFAMEDFDIDRTTISAIYSAVRVGGRSAWDNNAELRERGERRILKRYPEDPTTRWADWKQQSDVF